MRVKPIFLTLLVSTLFSAACSSEDISPFTESDTVRMETGNFVVLSYDPLKCQMAFNREKCEFRVNTDEMSDWFIVSLSEIPVYEGQIVSARLSWTTENDMAEKNNVAFTTMKLEGNTIWLWNSQQNIKLALRLLN